MCSSMTICLSVTSLVTLSTTAIAQPYEAEWPVEAMKGNTLFDYGGHGNDGQILGPAWIMDDGRICLRFDGADDYVRIPDHESLDFREMTLEAIVLLDATDNAGLVGKWGIGGYPDSYVLYVEEGHLRVNVVLDGVPGQQSVTGASPVPVTEFFHAAATFDGEALRLYLNHVLDGELLVTGRIAVTDRDVVLGVEEIASATRHFMEGLVDHVRISPAALEPGDFLSLDPTAVRVGTWGEIKSVWANASP